MFLKFYFLTILVTCMYVCLCVCAPVCKCSWRPEGGIGVPGVRVTQYDVLGTELQYPGRDKDFFLV